MEVMSSPQRIRNEYWRDVAKQQIQLYTECPQTGSTRSLYFNNIPQAQNTRIAFLCAVERGHACGFLKIVNRSDKEWDSEGEGRDDKLFWGEPYKFVVKDSVLFLKEFAVFFDTPHSKEDRDEALAGKHQHHKTLSRRWTNIIGFKMVRVSDKHLVIPKTSTVQNGAVFVRHFDGISPNEKANIKCRKRKGEMVDVDSVEKEDDCDIPLGILMRAADVLAKREEEEKLKLISQTKPQLVPISFFALNTSEFLTKACVGMEIMSRSWIRVCACQPSSKIQ